jgi:hypothetical protein
MTTIASSIKGWARPNRPITCAASIVALLLWVTTFSATADHGRDNRAPEVPAALQVPDGNKVSFHAYAVGVQIYVATPSPADPTMFVWTFKAPEAVLFAAEEDDCDDDAEVVGIHYAGPTWESVSGSKVVGARVAGVIVDPTAIPWLLLRAASTEGHGIFERTTFVQRVNTTGGLAPATAPTQAGQEARVPYTADYYFFRATHH